MNTFFTTQRFEHLFEYDSKNWTKNWFFTMTQFFLKNIDAKNWTFFFLEYHAKNWTFLWLKELNHWKKKTQRNWTFSFQFDSENWTAFQFDSKELNFICLIYDSKELNFFCLIYDSKNWTFFWIWFKESNLLFYMTQTLFQIWHRIGLILSIWLKELNFFNMTQRIQCLKKKVDAKNWTFFSWIWRKELNLSYMTQRIEFSFEHFESKIWIFVNMTQKNWTLTMIQRIQCVKNVTQRIELFMTKELNDFFFSMWLKEMDPFLFDVSQRIEPFLSKKNNYASKNWTLLKKVWLKELTFFFTWLKELHFFMTQRIELFLNMTQSIEFLFDSKNWTLFQKFLKELMFFIFFQKLIFLNMTQKELNQWKKKTQIWTFSFQISL